MKSHQFWHLFTAGWAAGAPYVQNDPFSLADIL